jgi:hypothetical protein
MIGFLILLKERQQRHFVRDAKKTPMSDLILFIIDSGEGYARIAGKFIAIS